MFQKDSSIIFLGSKGNLEKSVSPWQTRAFALLRLPSTAAQSRKLFTSGKHDCVYSLIIFQFVLYLCTVSYCQKCNAENKGLVFLNSRRLLDKLKSHTIALFCNIVYNYRGSMVVHESDPCKNWTTESAVREYKDSILRWIATSPWLRTKGGYALVLPTETWSTFSLTALNSLYFRASDFPSSSCGFKKNWRDLS